MINDFKVVLVPRQAYDNRVFERDEARRWARKLYKRLCDERTRRIVAEAIHPYWAITGPEIAAERDNLLAENAALRRERETIASVINQNYVLTKECDILQADNEALRRELEAMRQIGTGAG